LLAAEQGLLVYSLPKLLADRVNSKELKIYSTTIVTIKVVDSRGKQET